MKLSPVRVGERYGLLRVIAYSGVVGRFRAWSCFCDCGQTTTVRGSHLASGNIKSCGCLLRKKSNKIHGNYAVGATKSPEFQSWLSMRSRCEQPTHRSYKNYGGRGVAVCDEWRHDYAQFLKDMGKKPSPEHTIERVDSNRGYEKGNCVWATNSEQQRNKRNNRNVEAFGMTKPLAAWAEQFAVRAEVIGWRLTKGWAPERAVSVPVRAYKRATHE
jgi:hypothetical protein